MTPLALPGLTNKNEAKQGKQKSHDTLSPFMYVFVKSVSFFALNIHICTYIYEISLRYVIIWWALHKKIASWKFTQELHVQKIRKNYINIPFNLPAGVEGQYSSTMVSWAVTLTLSLQGLLALLLAQSSGKVLAGENNLALSRIIEDSVCPGEYLLTCS